MHELGIKILIISNAAGGINENFERGDLMLIKDQLFLPGLAGFSPLVGLNGPEWGPKFVSLHDMYNKDLRYGSFFFQKFLQIHLPLFIPLTSLDSPVHFSKFS